VVIGIVILGFLAAVVLVAGGRTCLSTADTLGSDCLKGMTLGEAAQTVGTDYVLEVRGVTRYTSQPKGTIAETPARYVDEPASPGSVIPLWLSSGEEDVTVPDVTGMSVLEASKTLLDAGLYATLEPGLDAAAAGAVGGWIRMSLDQNGDPVTATVHTDVDEKPGSPGRDVTQRTVTKAELSGQSKPAAGSKIKANTLIFLEYS
jgi:hypothetical protein